MSIAPKEFRISESRNCPIYAVDDQFRISGVALSTPPLKATCLFLARILHDYVVESMGENPLLPGSKKKKDFNCPGCAGLVKLSVVEKKQYQTPQMEMLAALEQREKTQKRMGTISSILNSFSFFQALEEDSLKDIMTSMFMVKFAPGEVILKMGEPGSNLYVILGGRVSLYNADGVKCASLGRGEIIGEMSLLSGQPVSATVKAAEQVKALRLGAQDFEKIMVRYPFLQTVFNRVMVQRLSRTTDFKGGELSSDMAGQLSEISPAELFQMVHENQKSGAIVLKLADGRATMIFDQGELVDAQYQDLRDEEAFYAVLKANDGSFSFTSGAHDAKNGRKPVGAFMKLLMEGLRRVDEANAE